MDQVDGRNVSREVGNTFLTKMSNALEYMVKGEGRRQKI